jgi:hypothetical protein
MNTNKQQSPAVPNRQTEDATSSGDQELDQNTLDLIYGGALGRPLSMTGV